ncbi:glycosyltransferase [Picrophilus oshimae]|uniref:Cellulose synthase (UDP-forming) n=1 Tax=Picrophilus torridus (strain ATCC 700027 / DSM 9790 / JCM 10055 / NBRC 100828 / KAW 2/3) TaxID=1122961 RepID=A0A8G2FXW5_PICTO|nr:glycosyltransferase [Picrophilus oshimae]SMD31443.1 cellulose synthase (UDP-forming) [Picrophilus oshimae DSM 9789]
MIIKRVLILILIYATLIFIFSGIILSFYYLYIFHHGSIADDVFSVLFWIANLFFAVQSLSLLLAFRRSMNYYSETKELNYLGATGQVAVLVPVYNEDINMVRKNLMAILNNTKYNANIYVLDDSTDGSFEKNLEFYKKINVRYIHRKNRNGYKAGALNNAIRMTNEEYIAVIDIDQMPAPDFIKVVSSLLDKHHDAGFVQVPQYYANTDSCALAYMADGQQFIFYDILMEGKSIAGTVFSCGTNIVYRRRALESVNGFDEENLVEDIATSINLIKNGWTGYYYNEKLVFGRAPVTMEGYINQQWRWARGSLSLIPKIFKNIIMNKNTKISQKIDWTATSIWYLFGWFYLIFLLAPALSLLGIYVLSFNYVGYIIIWMPYSIFSILAFSILQLQKGAPKRYIFLNMAANIIMFPLSINATISTVMHKKRPFTTARTGGVLPWIRFWPQFAFMILLFTSGILLIIRGDLFNYITAFWAFLEFTFFIPIFFINRAPRISNIDKPVFIEY